MTTTFDVKKSKIERVWGNFKSELAPRFKNTVDTPKGFLSYKATGAEIISLLNQENNFHSDDVTTMVKFIELCNQKKKLLNWSVVLKTTGSAKGPNGQGKKILSPLDSNLIDEVELSIRRGPTQSEYRKSFLKDHKFHMTGKNANIISSPKDLSVRLNETTIERAENQFYEDKIRDIQKKKPLLTKDEARKEIKTIPERVYRERMSEDEAVLIIYLFDSHYSFNHESGKEDLEFMDYVEKNDINLNVPLVGYAIGFPPIENDPGGIYVQGDYDLDEDEYLDEYSDEDSSLPDDSQE